MPVFVLGNWSPAIGDPSFMGWFIVYSYYGTALVCLATALYANSRHSKTDSALWLYLFFFMALLGACKQLNLLSAITEIGRIIARSEGWIQQRRLVQICAVSAVAFSGLPIIMLLLRRIPKRFFAGHRTAFVFIFYLFAFVILRATSFHAWEAVLDYTIFRIRINWIGELLGIFGVCFSALFCFFIRKS